MARLCGSCTCIQGPGPGPCARAEAGERSEVRSSGGTGTKYIHPSRWSGEFTDEESCGLGWEHPCLPADLAPRSSKVTVSWQAAETWTAGGKDRQDRLSQTVLKAYRVVLTMALCLSLLIRSEPRTDQKLAGLIQNSNWLTGRLMMMGRWMRLNVKVVWGPRKAQPESSSYPCLGQSSVGSSISPAAVSSLLRLQASAFV